MHFRILGSEIRQDLIRILLVEAEAHGHLLGAGFGSDKRFSAESSALGFRIEVREGARGGDFCEATSRIRRTRLL
ncbi:hypothetical protein LIA77_09623 [Sarocladium implicatum]|nr:hypothetical protein LIA77_09623 [Sarocladium implicatum]